MPAISVGYGNLYGGYDLEDKGWGFRIAAEAALVESMGTDLFVAVELHEDKNMHELFVGNLGAAWSLFEGIGGNQLLYRNAVIAPISKFDTLLPGNRWFTRWQVRHIPTGFVFWVGGAHLIANDNSGKSRTPERRAQATEIARLMRNVSPAIIAGDFNSSTTAAGYPRAILSAAGWTGLQSRGSVVNGTVSSKGGDDAGRWIEDILTPPYVTVSGSELVLTNELSDHAGWLKTTVLFAGAQPPITIPEPVLVPETSTTVSPTRDYAAGHVPLSIEVWDNLYNRKGIVGAPISVNGMIAHNGPGSFEFTVESDHRRVPDLTAAGARAVVRYRYAPGVPDQILLSGTLAEVTGAGAGPEATRTFRIQDDWTILNEIVGFPNPTGSLTQQGDDSAFFTRTGVAEDVLKAIVNPNATRQGVSLTVPSSYGRGSACTVSVRMHPLSDRLFPAMTDAGIGVRVVQVGGERYLIVTTPKTYDRTLTEASGAVVSGEFTVTPPTITRVIVGAGGEGKDRIFREYVDEELEEDYRFSRATFVDAADASSDWEQAQDAVPERLQDRKDALKDRDEAKKRFSDVDQAFDAAQNAVDKAQDDVDDHPGVTKYVTRLNSAKAARTKAQKNLDEAQADLTKAETDYTAAINAYTAAVAAVPAAYAAMGVEMQARADAALLEGAPKASLKVVLAETKTFRFGRTVNLGDRVTIRLDGTDDLSDVVSEVQFSYSADDGLVVTPVVGEWSDSTSADLYRKVATLARSVRTLTRR